MGPGELKEFKGLLVLIFLGPCEKEHPHVHEVAERNEGFERSKKLIGTVEMEKRSQLGLNKIAE